MIDQVLIKICGIKTPEMAITVADSGADYIGMVFHKPSKRYVKPKAAKKICNAMKNKKCSAIGVFVNQSAAVIAAICQNTGIEVVQLHGLKAKNSIKDLPRHLKIIYAISVGKNGAIFHEGDIKNISLLHKDRDFLLFDNIVPGSGSSLPTNRIKCNFNLPFFLAGGLDINNVRDAINVITPNGVDLSSGVENTAGEKDPKLIKKFIEVVKQRSSKLVVNKKGRYGKFGGRYLPEILITPIEGLEDAFNQIVPTKKFQTKLSDLLKNYAGRETPLTKIEQFSKAISGPAIYLKREDLLHTGAHKINNALGQCLLAKEMGKTRIIAETGAGQHGLATATACARLGLDCVVYMGEIDIERQAPNVAKMKLLGATVKPVSTGGKTLKDAINEALRDYATNYETSHYCIGSALGPHPYPEMVRVFQSIIGEEVKKQSFKNFGGNPDAIIACVGGGSNAIGIFSPFIDGEVQLIGVEAGGSGAKLGQHAARFQTKTTGVLHGCCSYLLQDNDGQIASTHSISAGLDYPSVGPLHAELFRTKRVSYAAVNDNDAVKALKLLSETEGIIPALESAHALGYLIKTAKDFNKKDNVIVNLSGRGDKDLPQLFKEGLL